MSEKTHETQYSIEDLADTLRIGHRAIIREADEWRPLAEHVAGLIDAETTALRASLAAVTAERDALADALADLYCARLREGWEAGPTEDVAANRAVHLCANSGIDVFKRLDLWRSPSRSLTKGEANG